MGQAAGTFPPQDLPAVDATSSSETLKGSGSETAICCDVSTSAEKDGVDACSETGDVLGACWEKRVARNTAECGPVLAESLVAPDICVTPKDEPVLHGSDRVLPPCLALKVEAQTSSTVASSAGELSSRSSHNTPPGETEDEKVGNADADIVSTQARGGDCCQLSEQVRPLEVGPQIARAHPSQVFLTSMLTSMEADLQRLRGMQQWMVAQVEAACRWALGANFKMLTLVGSVALRVETPGSDVDVVCFTRPNATKGTLGNSLRLIRGTLQAMMNQHPAAMVGYSLSLIEDARVPILRVYWGPQGHGIAVDVLVDQRRPLDHVHWFQSIGAIPSPGMVLPSSTPVMVIPVALRSMKWWLRRRQLPPMREGGLPTLAWLLLALHACALDADTSAPPMTQLVSALTAFFRTYSALGGLDGVLMFKDGIGSSEFVQRAKNKQSPWSELSVLDPTQKGGENSELAPRLLPATQLLIAYELRRANALFPAAVGRDTEDQTAMRQMFDPVLEDRNSLPSSISSGIFAIMLLGDPCKGVGTLELAMITNVAANRDWKASFLHRSDTRSEVYLHIYDRDLQTGLFSQRRRGDMVLCPCHFVCRVTFERIEDRIEVDGQDLERFKCMQTYLSELHAHHQALMDSESGALSGSRSDEVKQGSRSEEVAPGPT